METISNVTPEKEPKIAEEETFEELEAKGILTRHPMPITGLRIDTDKTGKGIAVSLRNGITGEWERYWDEGADFNAVTLRVYYNAHRGKG